MAKVEWEYEIVEKPFCDQLKSMGWEWLEGVTMPRKTIKILSSPHLSPFEQIRRTNDAGNEYWSSRDFAKVLDYSDYRNFEQVVRRKMKL